MWPAMTITNVAGAEVGAEGRFQWCAVGAKADWRWFRSELGATECIGLGFATAFSHGFGEVGEEHREPEPEGDLQIEAYGVVVRGGCSRKR